MIAPDSFASAASPQRPTHTDAGMTSERTRRRMIDRLRAQGVQDELVLTAMDAVPRHRFVEEALASRAYEDTALPIGFGQTVSQPYIVASMIAALRSQRDALGKTLEIGVGCGYQMAVLAQLSEEVHGVERIAALCNKARSQLQALGMGHVEIHYGDGHAGHSPAAPFDSIIVAAATSLIPEALTRQLALGGRMILPLDEGAGQQILCIVNNTMQGLLVSRSEAVKFVPMKAGKA